jgi:hypothetical protein
MDGCSLAWLLHLLTSSDIVVVFIIVIACDIIAIDLLMAQMFVVKLVA